jgi:two-component system, NtrC family, response regulator GlrR
VRVTREATTVTLDRAQPVGPLGAVIRVPSTRATPREYRLAAGRCRIGAGKEVDIVIEDDTVSRQHVELSVVPEGVELRDLGSRNGTFYLGQRVEKITLALGSRIVLGRVDVQIDADSAALYGESDAASGPTEYGNLLGVSPAMRKLFAMLVRLQGSLVNVLVEGESGTGKELIARAVHARSRVCGGPFVAVNCGAIDRALARSELFGHKRGAFTGAVEQHTGAFEAASGGSLFLDEIGDLPLEVQPALLRALEVGSIVRLGETAERSVKVRLIAATHRDLAALVEAGKFREDLYYRLAVVKLRVPPLRERADDVEPLIARFSAEAHAPALPDETVAAFKRHAWPGNVRELKNAIQAFAAVGTVPFAAPPELPELRAVFSRLIDVTKPFAEQKERVLSSFVRVYLELLLASTGGNQSEAARIAGLERSYFGKLVGKLAKRGAEEHDDSDSEKPPGIAR